MAELWFALLCFMLIVYFVLDGWDIGAGVLHLMVAKNQPERREVIAAIGPLWSWHEVWLVAAGGTFVLAFPAVMAAAFSGFYLALWMVLWTLILRGISIEVGGHIPDALWQTGWDVVFAASNVLLAVLFGAALGNLVRGVPLDATGSFSLSLFTDFGARGSLGILDWYTTSVAVFSTIALAAHGATYLRLKTTGTVRERSERLARRLWSMTLIAFPIVSVETRTVRPDFYSALAARPVAWLFLAIVAIGAWALFTGLRGSNERRAFAGSCAVVFGLLASAAAACFPVILRSTIDPAYSLTAHNGAAAARGLRLALLWWPLAFVLAVTYLLIMLRNYAGKVRPAQDTQGFY